jgi:hypothetical protein
MRAHLYKTIADSHGEVPATATIALYQAGTATLISDTIYNTDVGSGTLSNPFTAINGIVDFYLNTPQRVRIGVTLPSQSEQYLEDVDVLYSDYLTLAKRGAANGIASLDSNTKVPVAQLPTNSANGVAGLDAGGHIATAQLPLDLGITTVPSQATVRKTASNTYTSYDAVGNVILTGAAHTVINSAIDHVWNSGNGGGDVVLLAPRTKSNDAYELIGQINGRKGVRIVGEWGSWGSDHSSPKGGSVLRAVTGGVTWTNLALISAISSSTEDKSDFATENITFDGAGIARGAIVVASHGATISRPRIYNFLEYGIKFTSNDLPNTAYEGMRALFPEVDMANNTNSVGILVQNGSTGGGYPQRGDIVGSRIWQVKRAAIDTTGGPGWAIDGGRIYSSTLEGYAAAVFLGDSGTLMDTTLMVNYSEPWVRAYTSQFMITSNQFINGTGSVSAYIEIGVDGGTVSSNNTSSVSGAATYFVSTPDDLSPDAGLVITGNVATDCAYICSHGTLSRPSVVLGANFPALFETE